ncbi:prepilin peptidase [Candidatus Gracilibacteria bacterium]|jgi:prepilin signal peptidase PulO-like enzyme (type II secretory pathway)|nr:prepilin peptidase [Candidatus Gracilibacteria bacterium]
MIIFFATLAFILGTILGSFLSVVIYRTKTDKPGMVLGRSICPFCKKKLKFRYLIPVLSWLFLRGKCGYCGKKIGVHYLALEIITGLIFLATFLNFNFIDIKFDQLFLNYEMLKLWIFYTIEFLFLTAIFFYDLQYKEIPDRFSLTAIVIAIAGNLLFGTVTPINMAIGGASIFLFFALQFLLSNGKWIGGGDLRLGLLIGILLGWEKGLVALTIAYIVGAILSLVLMGMKKLDRKSQIPFGPFLITGTLVAFFFGKQILDWYLNGIFIGI